MVEIHLYGRLKERLGPRPAWEEVVVHVPAADGATIADVLTALGIAPEEVSHLFLNAEYSGLRRKVRPGDRLGVFPKDMALLYRQYFPRVEE